MLNAPSRRVPMWVTLLIIFLSLPVFAFPKMLANCPADPGRRTLLWIFPFYVVLSAVLAWISYATRPYVTWILMLLMVLSEYAAWMLVTAP